MISIYTDGSYSYKDGVGACAFAVWKERELMHSFARAYHNPTTVNRMEFRAILHAVDWLRGNVKPGVPATVTMDSRYCLNALTQWICKWESNGWLTADGLPVANRDLIQAIDHTVGTRRIRFHWVRAHSGDLRNEYVDNLAVCARFEATPIPTMNYSTFTTMRR